MATIEDVAPADGERAAFTPRVTLRGIARALPTGLRHLLWAVLILLALTLTLQWTRWGFAQHALGFDFEGTLWRPAEAIREGLSPYPAPVLAEVDTNNPAIYPPFLPVLLAPLTVAPYWVGLSIWTIVLIASLALTLYALGVRDPRCYAVAFVSAPAATSFAFGNVTLFLVLLIALAWRWRDRWLVAGGLIGIAIAIKLFPWPLVIWLLGTRRYKAALASSVVAVAGLLVPWAVIGFDGLVQYPDLLRIASEIYGIHSFSVSTILSALGVNTWVALQSAALVALVGGAASFLTGRRGLDELSVSIATLAALLGTPIVWDYNYALLLVPLALVWPRLSFAWIVLPVVYTTHFLPRPWLTAEELEPGGTACCRPDDVPAIWWNLTHAPPGLWPALGHVALACAVLGAAWWRLGPARTTERQFRTMEPLPAESG